MKKFILFIDQFGQTPQFLIKKDTQYHSFFGGLMTIAVYIIAFIAFCFFCQEIFLKKSPSVNLSTETYEHPAKIPLFDNFELLVGIQNPNYVVEINETIFYAKGFLFKTTVNDSGSFNERVEIALEPCSTAMKDSINYEYVKHLELDGYYCFSRNQPNVKPEDLYINEFWGNNGFQMLQIKFYDCVNTTEKQDCASTEVIDEYLHLTDLSLYYMDTFIRTRNYKNPYEKGIRETFYYVSNEFTVSLTEYIRHMEIVSDDGLLFTTNNVMDHFKLDSMVENTIYQRDSLNFISLSIQLNNIKESYYRKYYKLQDLAAQVGGIFKTLVIIFFVCTKFHSEHTYYQHLINSFYEVKTSEDDNRQISKLSRRIEKSMNSSSKQGGSLNGQPAAVLKDAEKEKPSYTKNKRILNLKFIDKAFLLSIFPNHSYANRMQIKNLYFNGRDKLTGFLEVDNVIKHFHNQETLNSLLFSDEQMKIFNYIFKPIATNAYIGTRYAGNNIPSKIKQKLTGADPWFANKVLDRVKTLKLLEENRIGNHKDFNPKDDSQEIEESAESFENEEHSNSEKSNTDKESLSSNDRSNIKNKRGKK